MSWKDGCIEIQVQKINFICSCSLEYFSTRMILLICSCSIKSSMSPSNNNNNKIINEFFFFWGGELGYKCYMNLISFKFILMENFVTNKIGKRGFYVSLRIS